MGNFSDGYGSAHGYSCTGLNYQTIDYPDSDPGSTRVVGLSAGQIVGNYRSGGMTRGFSLTESTYKSLCPPFTYPSPSPLPSPSSFPEIKIKTNNASLMISRWECDRGPISKRFDFYIKGITTNNVIYGNNTAVISYSDWWQLIDYYWDIKQGWVRGFPPGIFHTMEKLVTDYSIYFSITNSEPFFYNNNSWTACINNLETPIFLYDVDETSVIYGEINHSANYVTDNLTTNTFKTLKITPSTNSTQISYAPSSTTTTQKNYLFYDDGNNSYDVWNALKSIFQTSISTTNAQVTNITTIFTNVSMQQITNITNIIISITNGINLSDFNIDDAGSCAPLLFVNLIDKQSNNISFLLKMSYTRILGSSQVQLSPNISSYTMLCPVYPSWSAQAKGIWSNAVTGNYQDSLGTHGFLYIEPDYIKIEPDDAASGYTWVNGISSNVVFGFYKDTTGIWRGFTAEFSH